MSCRDPQSAWRRYQNGTGPAHDLTVTVAKAIHEQRYPDARWEVDCVRDQWLAVGSWQAAEAVVAVLPVTVAV